MPSFTYAIIGTGALGGLYGALLQRSGAEVRFLVRSDFDPVRARGLRIDSHWGDFKLDKVDACASADDMPRCDVVCVCVKTTANRHLGEMLRPLVADGTVVILMQNGLGAEEEVAALFPQAKIAAGMCYLCSNRIGPGHIHHVDYGRITFVPFSSGMDDALDRIIDDFLRAKIPVDRIDDLKTGRWSKLVWNIPYNGLSVVLDASTAEIMTNPVTAALSRALMEEVVAGGNACGARIESGYVEAMLEFTRAMKPYAPSMKLDFDAKRPLEVEYIYRRPLSAAERAGVKLPRIEMLATLLEFLDERNRPKTEG